MAGYIVVMKFTGRHWLTLAPSNLQSSPIFFITCSNFWGCALCYQTIVCLCLTVLSVLFVCNIDVLWPNGWMDQDETWHAGGPQPWPHCVRWGPSSPPPKGHSPSIFGPYLLWPAPPPQKGAEPPPVFGSCLLSPNGWIDQDGTWHGGGPRSRPHCAGWGLSFPPQKRGTAPNFWPKSIVAEWLDGSRCHLVRRQASAQVTLC